MAKKTTTKQATRKKTAKRAKNASAKQREGKLSALDAAAQVLAVAAEPMSAKALIEEMASQGHWKSPGGQTPHATLYSAMLREINVKGTEARFVKVDRGRFTLRK